MRPELMGHLADGGCPLGVFLMVAVGEIEAKGGGPRQNLFANPFRRLSRRPDGGHNFCAPLQVGLGHGPVQRRCGSYHPAEIPWT